MDKKRIMTINQKIRKKNKKDNLKLKFSPQYKGITLKIFTMTPKKPNSALRKVAKVKLNRGVGPKNQKIILAYIPKEKHTLNIHNVVLVRPGRTQDLPGLKFKIIRNVLDCDRV